MIAKKDLLRRGGSAATALLAARERGFDSCSRPPYSMRSAEMLAYLLEALQSGISNNKGLW